MNSYELKHAKAGISAKLPDIECWQNQFRKYEINITISEFTSVCPKTKLPDFGIITIKYIPDKLCLELKSLKMYMLSYRNLGIFYENVVNKILNDISQACKPKFAIVTGEFKTRGGINSTITAKYPR